MKIAIIYRLSRYNRQSFCALRGALERNGIPEGVDTFFLRPNEGIKEVARLVLPYDRSIICYSFTTPQANIVAREVAILKGYLSRQKGAILLAGGPHPSGAVEDTLSLGFDLVVKGEGEETFPHLVHRFIEGKSFKDIQGISFKENEKVISNLAPPPIDLDLYPPFAPQSKMFGKIEISRGCPFGCRFCQTSYLFGSTMRHRNIDIILKYGKMIVDRGLKDIHFITPNALAYGAEDGKSINYEALERLLAGLRREIGSTGKIHLGSYPSEVRPEMVTKEALFLIKKYCNNKYVLIGAQSGSPRLLDHLKRGHHIDAVYNAIEIILGSGFKAYVDFIFGLPGEEDEDREMTLKAMKYLAKMGAIIHAHTFMPLAGTSFAKEAPSAIPDAFRRELKRLASQAKLFGQWEAQEKIGKGLILQETND
jgi:B12-binding domain/radical SAM domain protein